ncbi:MAG: FAD-binding protein [Planctomycetes bacterium]|nr:FAD-binding protein [Planctomycetota bacterium]
MTRQAVITALKGVVGDANVLGDPAELISYECDGFPIAKAVPAAVVFVHSVEETAACVEILSKHDVPIVPRGSGTGLTGACVAYGDGVLIVTSRMKKIVEVDLVNRLACVEAGVRNLELTEHVNRLPGGERLHFAPDPSSQRASTIAGNAATNAGGIHTLKYGVTTNHIVGLEMVLPDGRVVTTRCNKLLDGAGPDVPSVIVGSEGTMGIITKVWVRLTPRLDTFRTIVGIFDSSVAACESVAKTIAAGIVPAALEMMDGAMVKVVEDAFHYGFPTDAQALLLFELDGVEALLDEQMEQVAAICRACGARDVQCSADPVKRAALWSARKRAFGAIGRISPSYCTQDACVPRSMLPQVIERVAQIGVKYGLIITNVFHAGDGNVHPILLFDEDDEDEVRRAMEASHEILTYCIEIGGTLTGEHGVGVEKLALMSTMFDASTLRTFDRIKRVFDPHERINAGKMLPSDRINVQIIKPPAMNVPGGAM